ncbi:MAG TPA: DUF6755 family protein [Blastocatellia bacterium]|nr:DUF6755 family protein [Blastocatellia bacterium]
MKRLFAREPRGTIVYGILCLVMLLVVLQLWLQVAAIDAYLRDDPAVAWPEMMASAVCFLLNLGLQHYLRALDRK